MPNHPGGVLRGLVAAAALVLLAACASKPGAEKPAEPRACMQAQPGDSQVQRLGALFKAAVPLGGIAAHNLTTQPRWPLHAVRQDAVTPQQLACVRGHMTPAHFEQMQVAAAHQYARQHPERVACDIELLENGGGAALNRLVQMGSEVAAAAQAGRAGAGRYTERFLEQLTPQEGQALLTLLTAPQHRALRQAMQFDIELQPRMRDNLLHGAMAQRKMMAPLLLSAFQACQVSLPTFE